MDTDLTEHHMLAELSSDRRGAAPRRLATFCFTSLLASSMCSQLPDLRVGEVNVSVFGIGVCSSANDACTHYRVRYDIYQFPVDEQGNLRSLSDGAQDVIYILPFVDARTGASSGH